MSSMPWIKLYTEMLYDPKIGRLQDAIKWRFVSLVLLAGECDQDGALMDGTTPLTIDDIAWKMRVTREQCETEIESLLNCGLIALDDDLYYLPKFSERQGRPQSEKREMWRNRKAKQRELQVSQETEDNVTRESRVSHAPRVDKSREDKNKSKKREDNAANAALPRPAQTYIDAGGKFQPGKLQDGTTKKDNAIRVICETVTDDDASIDLWRRVVTAYCAQWSSKSYTIMLNEYYLQGRVPGQARNGNGSNGKPPLGGMLGAIARAQQEPGYYDNE